MIHTFILCRKLKAIAKARAPAMFDKNIQWTAFVLFGLMVASAISSPMYYKKTDDDTYEPGNYLPILDYWIRSYLNIDDIRERNLKKWKKQNKSKWKNRKITNILVETALNVIQFHKWNPKLAVNKLKAKNFSWKKCVFKRIRKRREYFS